MTRLRAAVPYLALGLGLFILLHYESVAIGPVKVSQFWKAILAISLAFAILGKSKGLLNLYIYRPLVLLMVLQIFNYEALVDPINWIGLVLQGVLLPTVGIFLMTLGHSVTKRLLLFFSLFVVISFVPFELGVLESAGKDLDMASFGGADTYANVGVFQTPHSASSSLAMAFLVLSYFWFTKSFNRTLILVTLIVCCYFLFATYVRAGLAMAVIGFVYMLWRFSSNSPRKLVISMFLLSVIGGLAISLVSENQILADRISGQRTYNPEESFERLGSGRGLMMIASFRIVSEFTPLELIFGVGETEQKNRMANEIGKRLVPHNGFLYLLMVNGILGLSVFLWFIAKVWHTGSRCFNEPEIILKSCLLAYVVITFVQNYNLIYAFIFLVMVISYSVSSSDVLRSR